jgi:hypothetical protein
MKNGTKKRAGRNGRAKRPARNGADDLATLLAGINGAVPPPPDAPAGGDDRARALAALADGSLLAPGADNLTRLGRAIAAGHLDDADLVGDSTRRKIIDFVSGRLREGGPAEKVAAAACLDQILARPNARAVPPGAAPSTSGVGDAEPVPGGGGPAPLLTGDNGAADEPPPGGRGRDGKFTRGNACARGNPHHRRAAALRAALGADLGEAELKQLGRRLFEQALSGDATAARLLLEYVCGRPRPCPDEDALDLMEWKLLAAAPSLTALWLAANEVVDVRFALEIWKKLSASSPDAAVTQLLNAVESEPERFSRDLSAERRARAGR